MKSECFSTGFMLPFTHAVTNLIVSLLGFVPCPETFNPELFENFVSGKFSVNVLHDESKIYLLPQSFMLA
jgi:hypothetical protein